MTETRLSFKEMCARFDVTPRTLRYYEYIELLAPEKEGRARSIGVSNFYPHVLTNFCETVEIQPMVNQVELHPYFTQENALATMKKYNIVPEAWAPLGGGRCRRP